MSVKELIVNAGSSRVVYEQGYPDEFAKVILAEAGVSLERYEEGQEQAK